jgi:hypothetical protein
MAPAMQLHRSQDEQLAPVAVGCARPDTFPHLPVRLQVVGYDNDQEAWIAKNTWGAGFAGVLGV